MENVQRCLVAIVARGTNSWPVTEEQRARHPGRPDTGPQRSSSGEKPIYNANSKHDSMRC